MPLTTGTSEIGSSGLRTQDMGLNVGTSFLGSGGVRTSRALDPLIQHINAMQGIDPSGKYVLADPAHYAMSLSQAGVFSDAFGSSFLYRAPNVQASPTVVRDPASGLYYVSADGADDTAVGSAAETVAAYTAVFRSPPGQAAWSGYAAPITTTHGFFSNPLGFLNQGSTGFYGGAATPRRVRRSGVELSDPFGLAPITNWMTLTVFTASPSASQVLALLAETLQGAYLRAHLAALRIWPADPSASVLQQTEQEMMRFFAPLIATNS